MSTSFARLGWLFVVACDPFGIPDIAIDADVDGVVDATDNCPLIPNPAQLDSDGDGQGDACSTCDDPIGTDLDGDGYDDRCDLCIGEAPSGVDADGDGIDDGCDPCIGLIGNTGLDTAPADGIDDGCELCRFPVVIDADNDGLDDEACDVCANGPPHDEDGDGVHDGCDNCPGSGNPDQDQTDDNDLIGAACDVNLEIHRRVVFDPFLIDTSRWQSSTGWRVEDDRAIAAEGGEAVRDFLAQLQSGAAQIRIQLPELPAGVAGIRARVGNVETARCHVGSDGTLVLDRSGMRVEAPGVQPGRIVLELSRLTAAIDLTCMATTEGAAPISLTVPIVAFDNFGLIGNGAAFDWVEAIDAFGGIDE